MIKKLIANRYNISIIIIFGFIIAYFVATAFATEEVHPVERATSIIQDNQKYRKKNEVIVREYERRGGVNVDQIKTLERYGYRYDWETNKVTKDVTPLAQGVVVRDLRR